MVRIRFVREPCLSDFASFVYEETTLVNDPIFSKDAVLEHVQTLEKKHDKKNKYGNFNRFRLESVAFMADIYKPCTIR